MHLSKLLLMCLSLLAFASSVAHPVWGADDEADTGRVRAPDFSGADGWLNTDKPISIKDLKGQVVILDFWTYGCINCIHVMPELKFLEDKYKDKPVVFIGVHSGKFNQEKDADHIRQAVLRYNITHPVAVDSGYKIWNAYAVNAWPTLVVVDPEGYVVGELSGEGHRDQLDRAIGRLLDAGTAKGTLAKHLTFKTERSKFTSGELEFPGKVITDAASKRLFISDTSHNRVVVTDLSGKIQQTIGSNIFGLKDGSFASAEFYHPQGLALTPDGQMLYVADLENNAVRAVDLKKQTVTTLAGTGAQSHDFRPDGPGDKTPLSSPWDLVLVKDQLIVAMAGTHQLWAIDAKSGHVSLYAGTGHEAAGDGSLKSSAFAQPSGLATDGKILYVASVEASSIQTVDLAGGDDAVKLLAGSGDLFDFGLKDGSRQAARFQHATGLALDGQTLYVADTYNNVIRTVDTASGEVKTFFGSGKTDAGSGENLGLYEPAGLSVLGDTLYIADTNHHRIVSVNTKTHKASVLDIATKPAQ